MITELINSSEFKSRIEKLKLANSLLKKEFFGIDEVIDKLIALISSWFTLPQLQTEPLIINLWGMTGVGKTSLLERLVSFLGLEDHYFHFDLGEKNKGNSSGIRSQLEDIYKLHENNRLILSFDEFQFARSINENNHEVTEQASRIIWQILGNGKFSFTSFYNDLYEIVRYTKLLRYQLLKGIQVVNGEVINQPKKFEADIERSSLIYDSISEGTSFFSSIYLDSLYEISQDIFRDPTELAEYLMTLDGQETINFLENTINKATATKSIDCSKALIFIVGNLDEAYTISEIFNPDISSDIYYEETKKISLSKVKRALRKRFRNEQIARLGNNHIIYPSLNSKAFYAIIDQQLEKKSELLKEKFDIEISFSKDLKELIYKEGVFPTQGARPLHTTIDNIVSSNLSRILYTPIKENVSYDSIMLNAENETLISDYYLKGIKKHTLRIELNLFTENLRNNHNDDIQVITAVHESGHAILHKALLGISPDGIVSVSSDDTQNGLTIVSLEENKIISRSNIVNENAVRLGGIVAEKLIFGEENITNGSADDLEEATKFTAFMYKKAGLGNIVGTFDINDNFQLTDKKSEIETEIKEVLKASLEKAEKVLRENYTLLLKLSEYLSKNSFISKKDFNQLYDQFIMKSYSKYEANKYRKLLTEKINNKAQMSFQFTGTDS